MRFVELTDPVNPAFVALVNVDQISDISLMESNPHDFVVSIDLAGKTGKEAYRKSYKTLLEAQAAYASLKDFIVAVSEATPSVIAL